MPLLRPFKILIFVQLSKNIQLANEQICTDFQVCKNGAFLYITVDSFR